MINFFSRGMNHLLHFCQLKSSPQFYFSMKEIAEMAMVWFVHTNGMGAAVGLPVGRAAATAMMSTGEVLCEALSVLIHFVAPRNVKLLSVVTAL